MKELIKINDYEWEIPKGENMAVPGKVFASEKLIKQIQRDETINQIKNVAKLPGILDFSFAMPDAHQGYGMSIGGVAAFPKENAIISPGMTGFDINCGVRLVSTNISIEEFKKKRKEVLQDIRKTIPSGVGQGGERYTKEQIKEILINGSEWALENGMATKEDLKRTEENGKMGGANPADLSQRALARGLPQLGTLGAGNHFIDIFQVEEIFDETQAKNHRIKKENIVFMIHCGSRGLGHQVASDYMDKTIKEYPNEIDRELAFAPFNSELGQKYFSAMKCAVNFAFCNRQIIMHKISKVLKNHFPKSKTNLVYDIAHNITKIEKMKIKENSKSKSGVLRDIKSVSKADAKGGRTKRSEESIEWDSQNGAKLKNPNANQEIVIVRKGATRSFQNIPVIIPGSMSTHSFLLVGTKEAEEKSFGSCCHGAGRAHSRTWTHKNLTIEEVKKILKKKDIYLEGSLKQTIEESELAYKNVEEVIDATVGAGLAKKVAKLKPLAVMIG